MGDSFLSLIDSYGKALAVASAGRKLIAEKKAAKEAKGLLMDKF